MPLAAFPVHQDSTWPIAKTASRSRRKCMSALRLLRLGLHLLAGAVICALIFSWLDTAGRAWWVRRWSGRLTAICGVRIELLHDGAACVAPRALIAANHVSWLDIFVINSIHPCRFVAKSDIRTWPLIGWLSMQAETVFIARGKIRDVRRSFKDVVASLNAGRHVAFFPEGTTAPLGTVLPFHANLFEAAIDARAPVQPCALRYVDVQGRLHAAVDFSGDTTFMQSVMMIVRARGLTAQLHLLPTIEPAGMHRRELAAHARRSIAAALGCAADQPGC